MTIEELQNLIKAQKELARKNAIHERTLGALHKAASRKDKEERRKTRKTDHEIAQLREELKLQVGREPPNRDITEQSIFQHHMFPTEPVQPEAPPPTGVTTMHTAVTQQTEEINFTKAAQDIPRKATDEDVNRISYGMARALAQQKPFEEVAQIAKAIAHEFYHLPPVTEEQRSRMQNQSQAQQPVPLTE